MNHRECPVYKRLTWVYATLQVISGDPHTLANRKASLLPYFKLCERSGPNPKHCEDLEATLYNVERWIIAEIRRRCGR